MERIFTFSASAVTLLSFVLTSVTVFNSSGPLEIPALATNSYGQAAIYYIFLIVLSLSFAVFFAELASWAASKYSQIIVLTVIPILGAISGFQSGIMTIYLAQWVDTATGINWPIGVGLLLGAYFDTVWVLVSFGKKDWPQHNFLGNITCSEGAFFVSVVNCCFYSIFFFISMVDMRVVSGIFPELIAFLTCASVTFVTWYLGMRSYCALKNVAWN